MFGFLARLFRRKDNVEKLFDRWKQGPTPQIAENLARLLIEKKETMQALELLKKARKLFPRAEKISNYYHRVLRIKSSHEIRSLRQALATNPRPQIYARLSELYRYLGHFEEALSIAHDGIQRYPDFSGNYLAIGRVYFSRFTKTFSARDGRKTNSYLEKAYELDSQNLKTIYHLASLYLRVGAKELAQKYMENLSAILPSDSRMKDLWAKYNQIPDNKQHAGVDYFAQYEATKLGQPQHQKEDADTGSVIQANEKLASNIQRLAKIPGVTGFQLVDQKGKVIGCATSEKKQAQMFSMGQELLKAARINSRRLTIGAFSQGFLVTSMRKIYFYDFNDVALAVFSEKNARDDLVQRKVIEFVEESLCEAAGV